MATTTDFIDFVCSQIAAAGEVRSRKMFGDYVVYLDEKPVITVCDGICYVKKLPAIDAMMRDAECGFPYEGAREHYILDIAHGDHAMRVVRAVWESVPFPKKRNRKGGTE
ncbi:MAG: TfoX/Sxy family protein [Bacteroidales bacterium]|nr:TfoX/Sxy family protein [Bacteroidales bacterium]